jgi:hypothetical protein
MVCQERGLVVIAPGPFFNLKSVDLLTKRLKTGCLEALKFYFWHAVCSHGSVDNSGGLTRSRRLVLSYIILVRSI